MYKTSKGNRLTHLSEKMIWRTGSAAAVPWSFPLHVGQIQACIAPSHKVILFILLVEALWVYLLGNQSEGDVFAVLVSY